MSKPSRFRLPEIDTGMEGERELKAASNRPVTVRSNGRSDLFAIRTLCRGGVSGKVYQLITS